MTVEEFLADLDHEIHDWSVSGDAMRWTPEPTKEKVWEDPDDPHWVHAEPRSVLGLSAQGRTVQESADWQSIWDEWARGTSLDTDRHRDRADWASWLQSWAHRTRAAIRGDFDEDGTVRGGG